jgi:hypothetical protein
LDTRCEPPAGVSPSASYGDIVSFGVYGTLYQAYLNGNPISGASWVDAGNAVVSIGATKRRWGLVTQVMANNQQGWAADWCSAAEPNQFFAAA